MARKKKRRALQILGAMLDWAEVVVASVFTVLLIFTFLFNRIHVDGSSMEDTLFDGDEIMVTGLFYEPRQGDVVICDSSALDKLLVKRVIALGGQRVVIDYIAGTVTVDGAVVDEPYLKYHALDDTGNFDMTYYDAEREVYEYDVPEGYVFLLGDNRDHSNDSRTFGAVPEEEIIGKAIFRFYSERARIGKIN